MSEIDVSKCEFCNTEDYEVPMCQQKKYRNEVEVHCREKKDCYYKQLQQLKAENEELRNIQLGFCQGEKLFNLYEYSKCLNEIEEIARTLGNLNDVKHRLNDKDIQKLLKIDDDLLSCEEIMRKHILQLINQAKEGN